MSDASQSIAALSPQEKRELLKQLLQEKANKARAASPLSYGQRALWFVYQLAPESAAYNVSFAVRIRSKVDVPALGRAFQALVARHASLQAVYTVLDDETVQEIHGQREIALEAIDVSGCSKDELSEQVVAHYRRPFDLEQGPVVRLNLFVRSETDHVLLMAVHHISVDGWSIGILLDEVYAFYLAELTGVPPSLPPVAVQYTDFVRWQEELLAGPDGERLRNYWLQKLAGELPVLNLPTDRPRPTVQTYRGTSCEFNLNEALVQPLKALAKAERTTLYTVILAAFHALLHRYTGQNDIVIGSPTVGRSRTEFQRVVGYFVNPVALRADFTGNPTFRAFLGQMRQTVLEALAHQDYPFPLLVEQLHVKRDPSRSPVFEVMFNLQKVARLGLAADLLTPHGKETSTTIGGLELLPFIMHQEEGQFDLAVDTAETDTALLGVIKYNTDLFDAPTIARLAGHFRTLLEGIAADPDRPLSDLPLLAESERHQLLAAWNDTAADYLKDLCVHQLFESQVERTPDSVAVVFEDRSLTYRELNERANQLAGHLSGLGVKPGVLVGICVERSLDMMIGLLGVLKAGGAYVPLDPAYPKERLAFMLADSQASVLVTQQALVEIFADHQVQVVCLDADWPAIAQSPITTRSVQSLISPDHLAYVIYTSGSTGKPKGVQIRHQSLANFLHSMRRQPGLTQDDILLAVTTLSFDIAGLELFLPLITGARVVIVSREAASDGAQLLETLTSSGATVMQATPVTWRLLLDAGWQDGSRLKALCGGEILPRDLAQKLLGQGVELWNVYGPTETTIWSTLYQVKEANGPIPVGRPIANTTIYVLDQNRQPVPVGISGELYIGGDGLAQGYLNRPDLTAERFVSHPFSDRPGERLYRTGDLARYLPDGNIEILGRIDHQVKVRGFRIELGEIEAVLAGHPAVKENVVVVREDAPGDKRLVAYVVPASEQKPAARELRRYLREQLPDYMVPSAFVTLTALPLTPNGKVDRKALPAPERERPAASVGSTQVLTPTESLVAKVWQEALKVDQVSVYDNFFDLGGHSLLSVEVMTRLQKETGVKLNLAYIRLQTLGQLAAMYDEHRQALPQTQ
ncbi:MAG: amino acid adenylation domain-containing protein [Chloroflexi bacterium]|nr:amino acid adenylation domain-containing protein [Chloroflexota bacterium]